MAKKDQSTLDHQVVLGAAREIHKAYEKWNMADTMVVYEGRMVRGISKELHETIEHWVDRTADADENGAVLVQVAEESKALVLCLDAIGTEFLRWQRGVSTGLSECGPTGTPELQAALMRLGEVLNKRKLPPPQPIKHLIDLGAPLHQIAIKYGWRREDGSPDIDKVQEEINEPGTHYNAETWVHPSEAVAAAETARLWAARKPRSRLFHSAAPAPAPVKRPLEEMIAARAPVEQIARLYNLEQEEVLELAQAQGVDLTPQEFVMPANPAVAHQQRMAAEEKASRRAARS